MTIIMTTTEGVRKNKKRRFALLPYVDVAFVPDSTPPQVVNYGGFAFVNPTFVGQAPVNTLMGVNILFQDPSNPGQVKSHLGMTRGIDKKDIYRYTSSIISANYRLSKGPRFSMGRSSWYECCERKVGINNK